MLCWNKEHGIRYTGAFNDFCDSSYNISLDFWLVYLDNVIIEGDVQIIINHLLMELSYAHFGEVMITDCKFLLSGFRFFALNHAKCSGSATAHVLARKAVLS